MNKPPLVDIFESEKGFAWRMKAPNGVEMCRSSRAYKDRQDAMKAFCLHVYAPLCESKGVRFAGLLGARP